MAEQPKNKLVPRSAGMGLWEIKLEGTGGNVPDELKGKYTNQTVAQRDIEQFQRKVASKVKTTRTKKQ